MNRSIRNKAIAILSAAALTTAAAACADDDNGDDETVDETTTTEAMTDDTVDDGEDTDDGDDEEADDEEAADDTIVDVAVAAGSFTILVDLVTEAGLADALATEELTVFAPTDDAFEALPPEVLEAVGNDPELLESILTYHVVVGTVLAADVVELDGQTVETLSGASFTIEVDGETVTIIDGAGVSHEVVDVDVMASNGVIHVLNSVLLPTELEL